MDADQVLSGAVQKPDMTRLWAAEWLRLSLRLLPCTANEQDTSSEKKAETKTVSPP